MSVRKGDESGFIDTQGIEVENVTDEIIYEQVLSVTPANVDHSMNFHQLTNDSVDKTFGLTNAAFDVVMMATQPELQLLLNLTIPVLAQLPSRLWSVSLTDQSNRTTVLSGDAIVKNIKILDTGLGSVQISFSLEFTSRQEIGAQEEVLNFVTQ